MENCCFYTGYLSEQLLSSVHEFPEYVRMVNVAPSMWCWRVGFQNQDQSRFLKLFCSLVQPHPTRDGSCPAEAQEWDQQVSGIHSVRYSQFLSQCSHWRFTQDDSTSCHLSKFLPFFPGLLWLIQSQMDTRYQLRHRSSVCLCSRCRFRLKPFPVYNFPISCRYFDIVDPLCKKRNGF